MARTRAKRNAFGSAQGAVSAAIQTLHRRMVDADPCMLTREEFIELFVQPELRAAWDAVSRESMKGWYNELGLPIGYVGGPDSGLFVQFCFDHSSLDAPLIPRATNNPIDGPIKQRIGEWAQRRFDLGVSWGVVKCVVQALGDICVTPAQTRYHMPAVSTLCSSANGIVYPESFLSQLQEPGVNAPPLPYNIRQLIPQASATITAAALVEDTQLNKSGPFHISLAFTTRHGNVVSVKTPEGVVVEVL